MNKSTKPLGFLSCSPPGRPRPLDVLCPEDPRSSPLGRPGSSCLDFGWLDPRKRRGGEGGGRGCCRFVVVFVLLFQNHKYGRMDLKGKQLDSERQGSKQCLVALKENQADTTQCGCLNCVVGTRLVLCSCKTTWKPPILRLVGLELDLFWDQTT